MIHPDEILKTDEALESMRPKELLTHATSLQEAYKHLYSQHMESIEILASRGDEWISLDSVRKVIGIARSLDSRQRELLQSIL